MFYDEIKALCLKHGVGMTELCEAIGISTGNIAKWKNGGKPRAKTLQQMAGFFEMPYPSFLYELQKETEPLPQQKQLSAQEQRLMAYFQKLSPESAKQLLEFAEFLSAKEKAPSEDGANS